MTAPHRFGAPKPVSFEPYDGILLVDKPSGPTSHDIVAEIRRHFRIKKVGHGGTLDPAATGLLVILLGRGTKISQQIMGSDKSYTGEIHLGITTNSQDADGEILSENDASSVTEKDLQNAMNTLKGDIYQTPPMVSAVKIKGVPLYKMARKGVEVERKKRLIHVYEFKLTDYSAPIGSFRVKCTKGSYVRTLCHDTGHTLGCGAHLKSLRRTVSGTLNVEDAFDLSTILSWSINELTSHIIPFHTFMHAK